MIALLWLVLVALGLRFKSKGLLETENMALWHQLMVLRHQARGKTRHTNLDRVFLVQLSRWFPPIPRVLAIVQPKKVIRWHRARFCRYWKSCSRGGRPSIDGELLKLGFEVAQSTAAKYMAIRRGPPSQRWRIFLRNHTPDIAAIDLFVVSTIGFSLLYALVIVRLGRRELVWANVTRNPVAEWIAHPLTEAFP